MWKSVATIVLLLGLQGSRTLACDNYQIVVNKMDTCKGVESLITLQNFTVTLSDDCRVIPTGCISNKAFKTAMVKYSITKIPMPIGLNGEFDACEELKNVPEDAIAVLQSMKAFTKCPAAESRVCGNKNTIVNISPYKEYLQQAAGRIRGELNIKHNSGTSCLKFDISIEKKTDIKKKIFKNIFKKNKKSRK